MAVEAQNNTLSSRVYAVDIPGLSTATFQEASLINTEVQAVEYRSNVPTVKVPGLTKYSNVTLKKGIFKGDDKFRDWINKIKLNAPIERETITIKLFDKTEVPVATWTLKNAWPCKITGTDLMSGGNQVAVETLELTCEEITRSM